MNYGYSHNGLFPFRYIQKNSTSDIITASKKAKNSNSLANLVRGFANRGISDATRKKIAFHCRTMSLASIPRTVRNGKGEYVKHHLLFITLTLPASQIGTDSEVTKNVLGTFLDRARKLGLLSNYIWRAEKQKSGNIHYHLLTDTFCSFTMLRNLWFISLRKNGYIDAYAEKFRSLSFDDYASLPFNKGKILSQVSRAYARGTRNNWQEPPAIDVKMVQDSQGVEKYISKYVSKDNEGADLHVSGRVWGCSRSVTDTAKNFKNDKEFAKFWFEASFSILKKQKIDFDFFSMIKCSLQSICAWFSDLKKTVKNLLRKHYTPCDYWRNSVGLFNINYSGAL